MAIELDVNNDGAVDISRGGTGGTTALAARANLLVTEEVEAWGDLNRAVDALAGGSPVTLTYSTNQTLTGNLTIPSHINLVRLNGATINLGGYTFDGLKKSGPDRFGFSTTGTGATNQAALANAIASVNAGGIIKFTPGTYTVTGQWAVNKSCIVDLTGVTLNFTTNAVGQGILVTASDVEIIGGNIVGPQYAVSTLTQSGIHVYGADAAHPISGLKITGTKISNWGLYGILLSFVTEFDITSNEIYNVYQAGIQTLSAWNGNISGNYVHDIVSPSGGGVYGIALSRLNDDSLSVRPNSDDITVNNNRVHNVTNWEGLDTHGGNRITFNNNIVTGCLIGINVAPAQNTADVSVFASQDIVISGNTIDSLVTDGSLGSGIIMGGASATIRATGTISGNTVRGYGRDTTALARSYGGIYLQYTDGVSVSGNSLFENVNGVIAITNNYGVSLTGNTIVDSWADVAAASNAGWGIYIRSSGIFTGLVSDNVFLKTGAMAAKAVDYSGGIYIATLTGHSVRLGPNFASIGAAPYLTDAGDHCGIGIDGSNVSTSGTGENNLKSVLLPAGRIGAGQKMIVRAAGTKTNANGNKTIKFKFGASSWTVIPAVNDVLSWNIEIMLSVIGTTSQKVSIQGINGVSVVFNTTSTASENMAADATLQFTGECAHASDVITQTMLSVQYL